MIIGLIGLGEMGSEIGRYLVMNDLEVISVYEGRSGLSKKRALNYDIKDAGSIEKFCMKSDLIISIIPPDKAIETAESYTSYKNKNGQIYCDLNAVSTMTAKKLKLILDEKKIEYVDGAIMGGPPTENYSPRIYLSGKLSEKLKFLNGKGMELMILKGSDFKASATKMVYASITKGSKALVAGALITAKKNDVYDELMDELKYSEEYFSMVAKNQLPSVKHKAYRWIGEMNEISLTFKESGLTGGFHSEAEKVYELIKNLPEGKIEIEDIINQVTDNMD